MFGIQSKLLHMPRDSTTWLEMKGKKWDNRCRSTGGSYTGVTKDFKIAMTNTSNKIDEKHGQFHHRIIIYEKNQMEILGLKSPILETRVYKPIRDRNKED